jgi:hypothetical protein
LKLAVATGAAAPVGIRARLVRPRCYREQQESEDDGSVHFH